MGKVIFSDDIYICTASMPHGAIDKTGTRNNPQVPELCYKNRETVAIGLKFLLYEPIMCRTLYRTLPCKVKRFI